MGAFKYAQVRTHTLLVDFEYSTLIGSDLLAAPSVVIFL